MSLDIVTRLENAGHTINDDCVWDEETCMWIPIDLFKQGFYSIEDLSKPTR